ncbi:hypothetical protein [Aliiroseovarius sp. PTFE2010]|uniref:hypothetical protein n=1 Tax=Aliiroseovarius sp. PTFE2010 TaxID=3417190 RepID=UPI003CF42330
MINMIVRMALRPLINRGINAGIDRMSKGKTDGTASPEAKQAQQAQAKEAAKRARQAARVTKRMGRF